MQRHHSSGHKARQWAQWSRVAPGGELCRCDERDRMALRVDTEGSLWGRHCGAKDEAEQRVDSIVIYHLFLVLIQEVDTHRHTHTCSHPGKQDSVVPSIDTKHGLSENGGSALSPVRVTFCIVFGGGGLAAKLY